MKLTEKLDLLLSAKGINRREFSSQSGIPYMTIVNFYEKGTENVKLSTLKKIANYFGVTLDYIADDSIESRIPQTVSPQFTASEISMVLAYRQASEDDQAVVDAALRKYYDCPVSASLKGDVEKMA